MRYKIDYCNGYVKELETDNIEALKRCAVRCGTNHTDKIIITYETKIEYRNGEWVTVES